MKEELLSIFESVESIYFNYRILIIKGKLDKKFKSTRSSQDVKSSTLEKVLFPLLLPEGYYGCEISFDLDFDINFMEKFGLENIYEAKNSEFHILITNGDAKEAFPHDYWFIKNTTNLTFQPISFVEFTVGGIVLTYNKLEESFKIKNVMEKKENDVIGLRMENLRSFVTENGNKSEKDKFLKELKLRIIKIMDKSEAKNPCVLIPFEDFSSGDLDSLIEREERYSKDLNSQKDQTYTAVFRNEILEEKMVKVSEVTNVDDLNYHRTVAILNAFNKKFFEDFKNKHGFEDSVVTIEDFIKFKGK